MIIDNQKLNSINTCILNEYIFFFGNKSPFSQWYIAPFIDIKTNLVFNCCEQYMMYHKAKLFNDEKSMSLIMDTSDPKKHKALGRKVLNYDDELWSKYDKKIVYYANLQKFSQNADLFNFIIQTENKKIVEASPYDKKWGIGLAISDKNILDESSWKGQNLLGKVLMVVRKKLQEYDLFRKPHFNDLQNII